MGCKQEEKTRKALLLQWCTRTQCAGKFQHALDVFTADQGHQEL